MRFITDGEKTVDGRKIKYEIKSGFYKWELEHKATVWDVETSLSAKGGAAASKDTTLGRAIDNLFVLLREKGHLEPTQESPKIEPPPLKEDPQLQPPSQSPAPTIDTPRSIAVSKTIKSSQAAPTEPSNSLYSDVITDTANNGLVLGTIVIGLVVAVIIMKSFCRKTKKPTAKNAKQRSGSSSGSSLVSLPDLMTPDYSDSICLTDEPSAPMLNNIVGARIHPDWYLFATQLGLSDATLRGIERNEGDTKHCFVKAMEHWKASPPPDKPFTWETIVTTLESPYINNTELASKIRSLCVCQ